MPKIQSIKELEALGFNTPNLLISLDKTLDREQRIDAWRLFKISRGDLNVSIRTERDGEYTTPHLPNISIRKADEKILDLIRDGYVIHVFDPIDPLECLHRGTVCFNGVKLVIEFLSGPGTVRDLEYSPDVKHIELNPTRHAGFPGPAFHIPHEAIWLAPAEAYCSELNRFRNHILEWSIYRNPVGKLKQREIYWELRRWQ